MKKFKPGDKVKRINDSWEDVKIGEIYEVDYLKEKSLYLKNKKLSYDVTNFILVEKHHEEITLSFDI
jgi:hypothetical protein